MPVLRHDAQIVYAVLAAAAPGMVNNLADNLPGRGADLAISRVFMVHSDVQSTATKYRRWLDSAKLKASAFLYMPYKRTLISDRCSRNCDARRHTFFVPAANQGDRLDRLRREEIME
jgi:hypothetical protein